MRVILTTINAKYIHTNRAIRLLTAIAAPFYDVSFVEFTIKESDSDIVQRLLDLDPDVLGISTYIWNGERFNTIIRLLKQHRPELIIIAGGPEMGEDPVYYFSKSPIDYIVKGEAEDIFVPLLNAIEKQLPIHLPGVATPTHVDVERLEMSDVSTLPRLDEYYTDDDYAHRVIYIEASRGCPFHCSYCLASLSNGVRHLPFEYVQHDITQLVQKGVKTLKFLDRTMNANPQRFLELCDYVSQLEQPVSIQFEISADILPPRVIDYLVNEVKPGVVRLEIGVQSVHNDTLDAVHRPHRVEHTLSIIQQLVHGGRVIIHTDLIAGLPYETLDKFRVSFHKTFVTLSQELQLGFLKLLRGSLLREQANLFGYSYEEHPPYEILSTRWLSPHDIERIKIVESALEALWNRQRATRWIRHLVKDGDFEDAFAFFESIGSLHSFSERLPLVELYRLLATYCTSRYPQREDYLDDLKWDYVHIQPIKPVPFWDHHAELLLQRREQWLAAGHSLTQWMAITKIPTHHGLIVIEHHPTRRIYDIVFSSN